MCEIIFNCFLSVAIAIILFSCPVVVCKVLANSRRKKHPVYFELLDAATKVSSEANEKFKREEAYFKYRVNVLTEGLNEGECTDEYFKQEFEQLVDRYIRAENIFKSRHIEIEKMLREADFYAKENNLLWGVLF